MGASSWVQQIAAFIKARVSSSGDTSDERTPEPSPPTEKSTQEQAPKLKEATERLDDVGEASVWRSHLQPLFVAHAPLSRSKGSILLSCGSGEVVLTPSALLTLQVTRVWRAWYGNAAQPWGGGPAGRSFPPPGRDVTGQVAPTSPPPPFVAFSICRLCRPLCEEHSGLIHSGAGRPCCTGRGLVTPRPGQINANLRVTSLIPRFPRLCCTPSRKLLRGAAAHP